MAACLHFEDLHASGACKAKALALDGAVHLSACRCRPQSTARAGEECSFEHSIVFIRRGAFVKHVAGERFTADANSLRISAFDAPGRTGQDHAERDPRGGCVAPN